MRRRRPISLLSHRKPLFAENYILWCRWQESHAVIRQIVSINIFQPKCFNVKVSAENDLGNLIELSLTNFFKNIVDIRQHIDIVFQTIAYNKIGFGGVG